MGYSKVRKRCHGGFRLKYPRRFSVQRLRERFVHLFRLLSRWKSSYGHVVQSLRKGKGRNGSIIRRDGRSSKRSLVMEVTSSPNLGTVDCRLRSFRRSNSFYSEAIADCLEFIKRSSISVEQKQICPR